MKMSKKQVMTAIVAGMLCGASTQAWATDPAVAWGTGADAIVAGYGNTASGQQSVAMGLNNESTGKWSTASGYSNHALATYATAVGGSNSVGDTWVDGKHSTAVGYGNTVYAKESSAVGSRNYINGYENDTAVGYNNAVLGPNSGAFGSNNTVGALDEYEWPVSGKGENTYVFGASNTVSANNALVLGNEVTTVADNSVVLGQGSSTEEKNTVSVGTEGSERRIVHVADGKDNNDAATYGQLKTEKTAREAADEELQNNLNQEGATRLAGDNYLNSRIDSVEKDANKGIAKASALAALHPLDYDPDNKFDVAAAGGFYKGENAFALGAFYRPSRNVMLSLATTVSSGDNAYNVGVTFKVGKSGKHAEGASTAELYAMIEAMQKRIADLEAAQGK